jgi:hypothetical protein
MRELNTKEKILVSGVGVLLAIFAIKNFILGPINGKTKAYSQQIEQHQMAIRKYMVLEKNRSEIIKAQKQIEGYSSFKGTDDYKSSMIMSKVDLEARNAKLDVLDMVPAGSSKVKGGMTVYRVSMRAEGQLKNVLDFLSGIEGSSILLQVEKIAMSVKDETGRILKIDVTILGVSFS